MCRNTVLCSQVFALPSQGLFKVVAEEPFDEFRANGCVPNVRGERVEPLLRGLRGDFEKTLPTFVSVVVIGQGYESRHPLRRPLRRAYQVSPTIACI